MTSFMLLGFALVFPLIGMIVLWYLVGRKGNVGHVDVAWATLIAVNGLLFSIIADGNPLRRFVVGLCIATWALRLAWHLLSRLNQSGDDPRYQQMKDDWGQHFQSKLLMFFVFQALTVFGFSIPLWVATGSDAQWNLIDAVGLIIAAISIGGESLADWQLHKFKQDPDNKGQTCDVGLWRYSRHPNYFFEWTHWFADVAFSLSTPWGWLTIFAPMLMLYFVLFVTGVGPAEKQSLRSRPESYRQYQKKTSVFVPWPPQD